MTFYSGNYGKKKGDADKMIEAWCKLLEMLTYRHRLLDAVHESDFLLSIYIDIARTLGIEECHAFLRPVSFEFAQNKVDGQKKPLTFRQLQDDESRVDRYEKPVYKFRVFWVEFLCVHICVGDKIVRICFQEKNAFEIKIVT